MFFGKNIILNECRRREKNKKPETEGERRKGEELRKKEACVCHSCELQKKKEYQEVFLKFQIRSLLFLNRTK